MGKIHHAIHGKIHYFDWAIFNSFLYVYQRVSPKIFEAGSHYLFLRQSDSWSHMAGIIRHFMLMYMYYKISTYIYMYMNMNMSWMYHSTLMVKFRQHGFKPTNIVCYGWKIPVVDKTNLGLSGPKLWMMNVQTCYILFFSCFSFNFISQTIDFFEYHQQLKIFVISPTRFSFSNHQQRNSAAIVYSYLWCS